MIRFVDIRNQGTGYRFAFYCTITGKFIVIDEDQAWDDVSDLKECCANSAEPIDIERLIKLCPDWAHNDSEDDLDTFWEDQQ